MEVDDRAWVEALKDDYTAADLSPRQRALCDYAVKLTREPAAMKPADLDALRDHGLTETDLLDTVPVISYFNYINRVAVPDEDDWHTSG